MILRDHALAFGGGEHRRAQPLGKFHKFRRGAAPINAKSSDQNRPLGAREHIERRFQIGAIRPGCDPVRHQRRLGHVIAGLARRLALRKFEMHRAGRRSGRRAHGAAYLLAHSLGVDGRAPLHDRLIDRELVDALAQAGLVSRPRIGIGDRDQRRAVEKGVRHTVDHVGGARSARGQANARAAGDVAPGRSQHGAGHFLFHQQKTHLALARRFHQFDRLAARMPHDERRAGVLERRGQHFDGRRHCQVSRSVVPAR